MTKPQYYLDSKLTMRGKKDGSILGNFTIFMILVCLHKDIRKTRGPMELVKKRTK